MFIVFVGIFFLVLTAFGLALVTDQVDRRVRASNPPAPDSSKSILLSSPKETAIGEKINVNAVARSADNEPVPRAEICISTTLGTVTPSCAESDEAGITSFVISSAQAGTAAITGIINGTTPINMSVTAQFTQ
jgi:hypothetical protein